VGLISMMPNAVGKWWLPAGIVALALAFSLPRLSEEKYNGDERHWIYHGERSWEHLRHGQLDHPFWSESNLLFGYASPPVAKYIIGIGLQATGRQSPRDEITTKTKVRTGAAYPRDVLWGGRLPSAILGALGIVVFFLVGREATRDRAAALGALLLATSPVWLASSRRAMVDIHGAALGLVALWLFVAARRALLERAALPTILARFAVTGVALGLTVGAKFNAAGVSIGLGALLLLDLIRGTGGSRVRSAGSGALMAAAALVTFVGLYPYLHHDAWSRFSGILEEWGGVRDLHVAHGLGAFDGSYAPGLVSFREAASMLLLPGTAAVPWLALPLATAILLRTRLRDRWPPAVARLAVWVLLLPAAIATLFAPGVFVHLWIAWVGLVGGLLAAIVPGESRVHDPRRRPAIEAIAFYTLGTLFIVLATTTISWPRYYIALFPPVLLVAGVGLDGLVRALASCGARWAAAPVILSLVFAALSVTTAYPTTGVTKIARLLANGWTDAGAVFLVASVVSFCLFPLLLARRAAPPAESARG
jgi:4-amino-4-deoxy-L-arabinose transferase-like glycosyltransferase